MVKPYQTPPHPSTVSSRDLDRFFVPPELANAGIESVHPYPLVMDSDKNPRGRRPAQVAWRNFPRVELQPPHCYAAILLDIDDVEHLSELRWPGGKPAIPATWIVQALDTGKMHLGYALETPVHRNPDSLTGPLNMLADVADRLTHFMGGDVGYGGAITRNPLAPGPGVAVHWNSYLPYSLGQLDKRLPKASTRPGERLTGIGRNVDLFRTMVKESLRPSWHRVIAAEGYAGAWLDHVRDGNVRLWYPDVLPDSECRSIAKSCAKFSLRKHPGASLSERQTKKNAKRWHGEYEYDFEVRDAAILSLTELGFKQREIAKVVGLSERHVRRRIASL